ncbi:MAG TPA: glycosyltransferase family 4 protein [Acidimicrobiales bacterium]|nr:glycosyltransferase family 4 protein [Acidimicrobiales bacterium]
MGMERPLRILQLLGPSTGGIRRHVAHLSSSLEERGHLVRVAGPSGVMEGVGRLDHVVEVPAGLDPRSAVRARRDLTALAAGFDLVHAHGLKAGWVAALVRRRPPLVVSVHNLVLRGATGRSYRGLRMLEAALPARVDAVIAVSGGVARRFSGSAGADRISVVPPAGPAPDVRRTSAEVRADLGIGPGEHLLVTAARLHPQKGLDVLIDAVAALRDRVPGVRAVVFGEGPLEGELRARIEALDLGRELHLAGSRASVADELAAADVVVVPSRWESGPLVVFEALALGRPVVTTAVGAAPQVVIDGQTGRLVAVDDAAGLARAVEEMLTEPAAAARMAAAGQELARQRFGPVTLVDGVEAVYRDVVGGS